MRRLALTLTLVAITFLGWKGFETYRTQQATREAVNRIAPLVEYRDLYENGRDREANDVLLKTVAAMIEADNDGVAIPEVLRRAERINDTPVNYSDLLTESLLRNLKIARELALDTPENVERMKEGKSPIVGTGPYAGEKAEVDHIIPRSLAPDLDNLLINLELMPMTLNRRKSDKVTERAAQMAKKFFEAGVMMLESYEVTVDASLEPL